MFTGSNRIVNAKRCSLNGRPLLVRIAPWRARTPLRVARQYGDLPRSLAIAVLKVERVLVNPMLARRVLACYG